MRFLDLCAGVGGFSLGLEWAGMTCAGQVEIDPFCNAVLEKHWPHVPRWKDVKDESSYDEFPAVDLICGGYPCQPFSHAGKRRGADDDRHLWPYVFHVCQRLRPAWCLFENVAGHVSMGLDDVLSDLEGEGYAAAPLVIPACAVDAPHRRDRVWIIAHAASESVGGNGAEELRKPAGRDSEAGAEDLRQADGANDSEFFAADGEIVANANGPGRQECNSTPVATGKRFSSGLSDAGGCLWLPEPDVGRVANGVPHRVDRLKALGNAVVPQEVYEIGRAIVAAHYGEDRNGRYC